MNRRMFLGAAATIDALQQEHFTLYDASV